MTILQSPGNFPKKLHDNKISLDCGILTDIIILHLLECCRYMKVYAPVLKVLIIKRLRCLWKYTFNGASLLFRVM